MSPQLWQGWLRLLLRLYPRRFQARFGSELLSQYPLPETKPLTNLAKTTTEVVRGAWGAHADDGTRESRWRLDALRLDLWMAGRRARRSPTLSLAVVLTFALSAGLSASVFTAVDLVLVRALPYPDEARLVSIGAVWTGYPHSNLSVPEYLDIEARARAFESTAIQVSTSVNLTSAGGPAERLQGLRASPSLFTVLGVEPARGRVFDEADDAQGVAVISHRLWQSRFAGREDIVGQGLSTDAGSRRIVAVMPAAFAYPSPGVDVWLPYAVNPANPGDRGAHNRQAIGRLRRDVTLAAASADLRDLATSLQTAHPSDYPVGSGWSLGVQPLRDRLIGGVTESLSVLAFAALAVLLLGCTNVANLFLARESTRAMELSVLVALGASARRLRTRAALEGAFLGSIGGALAILIASGIFEWLQTWLPDALPRPERLFADGRAVFLAWGLTLFAGALTAWLSSLSAVRRALRTAGPAVRSTDGPRATRVRVALVATQVTLAVTLLVSGGYALRSYAALVDTPLGFTTAGVTTARVALSPVRYRTPESITQFVERWETMASTEPGVAAAGLASMLPLTGQSNDWTFGVEGYQPPSPALEPAAQARVVSPGYFDALAIPLLSGRGFEAGDHAAAPRVAIVSAALARKYWSNGNPIGRRIKRWSLDSEEPWTTVIGVAGDVRYTGPMSPPEAFLYFPLSQLPTAPLSLIARFDQAPRPLLVTDVLRRVDPEQPAWAVRTLEDWGRDVLSQARLTLSLLALFGTTAVVLALVGLYGVIASAVGSRTRELGLRVALGATPASLQRGVVGRVVALTGLSAITGVALAAGLSAWLAAVFPGLVALDGVVWLSVAAGVVILAGVAALVPAGRAMRVDPIQALRAD